MVYLQIQASPQKCSTLCTVIDEIGWNELNRSLSNQNRRPRQTMNLLRCITNPALTPSIAPSKARAQRGRALRTQGPRSWIRPPISPSHESRGASTTARPREHHNIQRPSHLPFKCVVVNRSRTLNSSRICTHASLKSFAGALFATFRICSWSMTLDV